MLVFQTHDPIHYTKSIIHGQTTKPNPQPIKY
jgi:hypothetical protein